MNAGGEIQSASDSIEEIFGWTPGELFGRNVKLLIPEPRGSTLDRYFDRCRNADATTSPKPMRRFEAMRKDGKSIEVEMSMSRADLPSHTAPYFIGIIRDVSGGIDVSRDTVVERSRLQELITAQTRALATANLRLQLADRLTSLGTLATGLGHDMNNVLLPVRAHLNVIESAGLNERASEHLQAVRRSIAYLQQLSDGLHFLTVDPARNGKFGDGEGDTDLTYWWSQVGDLLRKAVPKHVKVIATLPKSLPTIRIASHWLTQAVLNLIVNAGESIPASRRNAVVKVWASTSDDGKMVRLGVTDNGRGMTHGVQRRALDLFFTTKSRGMGTGMGLPLVRKVAIRAGGDVEISSEIGRGTTVALVLPAAVKTAARANGSKPAQIIAAVSLRDHRAAALVTQILIAAKVEVAAAASGTPGKAALWVAEPLPRTLAAATVWRKGHPERSIVLLGLPPKTTAARWMALGAAVIHPPDEFETMRHVLGLEIEKLLNAPAKKKART